MVKKTRSESGASDNSDASKRTKQSGTKSTADRTKTSYNPSAQIAKGKCGYEGCTNKLQATEPDEPDAISCDVHNETWTTGYSYLAEKDCQTKCNSCDRDFSDSFVNSHVALHNKDDPILQTWRSCFAEARLHGMPP